MSLWQSNQNLLLGELEVNENDLKQCSVLQEYDGKVLSKLIEKVYIYGDGNLQVVFKNDDYFRTVCIEGLE